MFSASIELAVVRENWGDFARMRSSTAPANMIVRSIDRAAQKPRPRNEGKIRALYCKGKFHEEMEHES